MTTSEALPVVAADRASVPRAGFHPLRVARVDRLCEDAAAVTFDVPDDLRDVFAFDAGQSLAVRRVVDGTEQRRW